MLAHVSYRLNSLKAVIWWIIKGNCIRVVEGETGSLDYSPCGLGFAVYRSCIMVGDEV